jgi:hypothetical protein
MGTPWIAQEAELAQARAQIADLEALIMLRGIHIAKQDETIADLRAELERTLAALGDVVRMKNEKNGHLTMVETDPYNGAVCPRCGGPLDVSTHEFVPPFRCSACGGEWWLMQMPEYGGEGTA